MPKITILTIGDELLIGQVIDTNSAYMARELNLNGMEVFRKKTIADTLDEIQDALRQAGKGRTVLTIAHRLSTVAEADRIVVLEQGEVVEQGTHDDLLARNGRYAQLWQRQQSEGE